MQNISRLVVRQSTGVALAAILFGAALSACGQAAAPTAVPAKPAAAEPTRPAAAATTAPAAAAPVDLAQRRSAESLGGISVAPAPAAAARPAEAPKPAAAAPPQAPAGDTANQSTVTGAGGAALASAAATDRPWDRMIIRNGQLVVQVDDVERSVGAVRTIAGANGGFVSASSTRIEHVKGPDGVERDRSFANLTVQVRSDTYDPAVQALRALGKVESENGASQDVTEEYVDLDSNLRSLRATENAVMTMLQKATNLPDILTLQRELNGIRQQIERIEGRKRFLSNRSEFSTVAVTLNPPPLAAAATPTPTPVPGWTPVASAQVGWQASLRIVRALVDLAVVTIAFSWWLVPFGLLGAFLVPRLARRARTGGTVPTES
jgi:hypothetical protein